MKYLLNLETLDDTYIKKRIEEVCKANVNKPKTELNVHKDKYTKEQLTKIQETNTEMLYFFGYTNSAVKNKQNPNAFFTFE